VSEKNFFQISGRNFYILLHLKFKCNSYICCWRTCQNCQFDYCNGICTGLSHRNHNVFALHNKINFTEYE